MWSVVGTTAAWCSQVTGLCLPDQVCLRPPLPSFPLQSIPAAPNLPMDQKVRVVPGGQLPQLQQSLVLGGPGRPPSAAPLPPCVSPFSTPPAVGLQTR